MVTFSEAEVKCLPESSWPHRSQLFFSDSPFELDYVSSLINEKYAGEAYWIGIDDRDKNGTWTTSLNKMYPKDSSFFLGGDAGSDACAKVESESSGFAKSADCSEQHYYICETQQLGQVPDYPCPKDYVPYKDECLMPNPRAETYDNAVLSCATKGGIVLPIRDKGIFAFARSFGKIKVRNDVWVGMRKKKVLRSYDPTKSRPLIEEITDDLTYSDGENFDIENGYKTFFETKSILRGECFGLKSSEEHQLRDYKCKKEAGFICQWQKIQCPNEAGYNYFMLGHVSEGRSCYGSTTGKSVEPFMNGTCNSDNDLLRKRWTPKNANAIDLYRRTHR